MPSFRIRALTLTGAILLLCPSAGPARAQGMDHRYQTWVGLMFHGPVAGDLWLWADVHGRFYEPFEPSQLLIRPGLSYRITPDLFATVGYAWTPSWGRTPEPRSWGDLLFRDEHRLFEQVIYQPSDDASGVGGQLRGRLEQRFPTEGDLDVGVRLRILGRVQVPLTRDRAFSYILWDEAFFGFNETAWGQPGGFDQNRLFSGFGWQAIPGELRLELGYFNVWIVREARDTVNHALALNIFVGWR